ncbi:MAG: hypothetical protein AAGK32_12775, partial [Actinomycetota bacterium]
DKTTVRRVGGGGGSANTNEHGLYGFTNGGGNVLEIYRAGREAAGDTDGLVIAVGSQARALLFDPVLSREGFGTGAPVYVAISATVIAAVGVLVWRRRSEIGTTVWAILAVAAVALVVMIGSLAAAPSDEGFGNYRALASSPVAAFVAFALGSAILEVVGRRLRSVPTWVGPVAVASVVVGALAVAVPGPIDADTEDLPASFEATRVLVEESVPALEDSEGLWATWVIGGRTTPTIFTGVKAGLGASGLDTGIDGRAIGLSNDLDSALPPPAGTLIVMPSEWPAPTGEWERVAEYVPADRSPEDAAEVAERLVEFAEETRPEPLPAFTAALVRIYCPELAEQSFVGSCPDAEAVAASDNPGGAPPAVLAAVYLTQFGE